MKKLYLLPLLFVPSLSFAIFCPTNFQQINPGDTLAQVIAKCGPPSSQKDSTEESDNIPQEWSYYVTQPPAGNVLGAQAGSVKATIAFDSTGKAINISVNGMSASATTICGTNIQLGDTRDMIKSICGNPAFINKQENPATNTPPQNDKVTTVIYNRTPPNPPVTLTFKNGVLSDTE